MTGKVLFAQTLILFVVLWGDYSSYLLGKGLAAAVTCSCSTPNQGSNYSCTDGVSSWCSASEACFSSTSWFKGAASSSFCRAPEAAGLSLTPNDTALLGNVGLTAALTSSPIPRAFTIEDVWFARLVTPSWCESL